MDETLSMRLINFVEKILLDLSSFTDVAKIRIRSFAIYIYKIFMEVRRLHMEREFVKRKIK